MHDPSINTATILLVDDDSKNLGVLFEYLSSCGFTVLLSQDGKSAIQQAEDEQPDLILLDVIMPGMDGMETCRKLKAEVSTKDIPIIFLTALSETLDKVKGFEAGGADYITKPFQQEEVLARVTAHITIRQQQQQLRKLNLSKDKFFSILAHDLRGPLHSLHETTKHVERKINDAPRESVKEIVQLQRQTADKLCRLLEDLLTWSRMQRGMLEYAPRQLSLYHLAAWTLKLFLQQAEQKNVELHNAIPEGIQVFADLHMTETIFRNLISNALKFTNPGGRITLSASMEHDKVTITVADTGIGIEPANIAKLFKIDAKFQKKGTGGEKGTGLGLILCKEFVEQHRGRIWCESCKGQGSSFIFRLPRLPQETSGPQGPLQED